VARIPTQRGKAGSGSKTTVGLPAPAEGLRGLMIAWILAFVAGPLLLGGYGWYLCRGPRRRGITEEEIAQLQVIADIERDEDLF
jgi:hypothetical protein